MSTLYRNNIIKVLKKHYEAQIEFHKINVDILLDNIVAVAEHPDVMATIDNEIGKISEWEEKLQILNKYFYGVAA